MGKSIRSKVKRKNRAEMRKTIGEPARLKQIEQALNHLEKEAEERSGDSILKLKSVIGVGGSQAQMETDNKVAEAANEAVQADQAEVSMATVTETRAGSKAYKSSHKTKHQRPQKVRRIKPKELEWFK